MVEKGNCFTSCIKYFDSRVFIHCIWLVPCRSHPSLYTPLVHSRWHSDILDSPYNSSLRPYILDPPFIWDPYVRLSSGLDPSPIFNYPLIFWLPPLHLSNAYYILLTAYTLDTIPSFYLLHLIFLLSRPLPLFLYSWQFPSSLKTLYILKHFPIFYTLSLHDSLLLYLNVSPSSRFLILLPYVLHAPLVFKTPLSLYYLKACHLLRFFDPLIFLIY